MSETSLERVPCGICGSAESIPLFEAGDYLYGNSGRWPVARCSGCGVMYMNPRIPPSRIGAYYPKTYYTNSATGARGARLRRSIANVLLRQVWGYRIAESDPWWGRLAGWMLLPFTRRWSPISKYIRPPRNTPSRVLDVGCGNGGSLTGYRRLGWQTFGSEVGEDSARVARAAGHEVFVGELAEARYASDFFEAVTLWDALEHIHDPLPTLREVFRVCQPGGQVHISVPNAGSWYLRRFQDRWFMFTAPLHYYHYTEVTLRRLLTAVGLTDIEVTYPLGDAGFYPTLRTAAGSGSWGRLLAWRPVALLFKLVEVLMPAGHLHVVATKPASAPSTTTTRSPGR